MKKIFRDATEDGGILLITDQEFQREDPKRGLGALGIFS